MFSSRSFVPNEEFALDICMGWIIEGRYNNTLKLHSALIAGQPKRHLLTTGWSVFVSTKRLFAGDSVLFIRYKTET